MITRSAHQDLSWYVLHTKSRQEKILFNELSKASILSVLPLVRRVRYSGTRKVTVQTLLPGYLFLLGTREQMFFADRTKRVANVIHVIDQNKLDWELRNLQVALASTVPLDPFPYLKKGMTVEVRSGPFRGLQGVADSKYRDRLIIQIETLGRAVAIEMSASLLEPI